MSECEFSRLTPSKKLLFMALIRDLLSKKKSFFLSLENEMNLA